MIPAATIADALASAESTHAALISKAASLAGKPGEHDAWTLAGAAHRISANLRMLLATAESEGTP